MANAFARHRLGLQPARSCPVASQARPADRPLPHPAATQVRPAPKTGRYLAPWITAVQPVWSFAV